MAAHSSVLAWRIPWTEEPGGLQSMGSRRVRHDCVTEHAHRVWGDAMNTDNIPGGDGLWDTQGSQELVRKGH